MLGNPVFWNKIKVTCHEDKRYNQYQMIELPRIWLSRAKDFPCFIDLLGFRFTGSTLMLSHHHPLSQVDINKNIVRDLIAPHNCKTLRVMFADHHLHDLLQLSNEKLAYIEVLRLHYVNDANNREIVSLDFRKLTNLTSFSLDAELLLRPGLAPSTEDRYFQIFSSIPWHQLRYIQLDTSLPVLCCLTILEASSSVLETCSLDVVGDLSTSPLSQTMHIHCLQLREFKVSIYPKIPLDAGDSFLLLLQLPKLKWLTLDYPTWDWDQASIDLRTLFRMWSVCAMRLEKLIISGLTCKVDAGALLASMPSLRCLELPRHSIFTVDVIRKLGAGSIGPFLEELTINNPEITHEIGELIQMVKTRCSSTKRKNNALKIKPTPFKTVHLYCDDPDGSLEQEYDAIIDEVNELRYILRVKFILDPEEGLEGW